MNRSRGTLALLSSVLLALGFSGCTREMGERKVNPIIGAWLVKDAGAPFPYHMYVFNADGTMQQANPDAGDPRSSDSDGKGIWVAAEERIKGKWVEVIADRASHQYAGRTELTYDVKVDADSFAGTISASAYDAAGALTEGPTAPTPLEGKRVTLP